MYFGGHCTKSALTASPRVGIFADNLISIGLCIRFPKMFVFKNPHGALGSPVALLRLIIIGLGSYSLHNLV